MKGCHFDGVDDVKEALTSALREVPEKAFQDAYKAWTSNWKKCVDIQCSKHFFTAHYFTTRPYTTSTALVKKIIRKLKNDKNREENDITKRTN